MSAVGFFALFRWEWRQLAGRPLLWLVLLLLGAAFAWGAQSGAALHRQQSAAQMRTQADDAAWTASLRARAEAYAHRAAEPLPYWQDPTDIAGFSRYFLRQHAFKPHLPLSPLAVSGSDLLPTRLPLKLETPFGIEPVYDFEHPRGLALGRFDLGFAIAYLLPIAVILLIGLLGTFERDHGMLRLIAAQQVGPRTWLGARIAAILAWLLPAVALLLIAALALVGVDPAAASHELAAALALALAYTVFWSMLALVVIAAWPRAAGAIGVLTAAWVLLCIGVPLLANVAVNAVASAPSRVTYVDAQRRVTDTIEAQRDAIVTAAFRARPELAAHTDRIGKLDYATRLTFLTPMQEQRLAPLQARIVAARGIHEHVSGVTGFLAPPLGVEAALATLAGTDAARHRRFETQARAHQQHLRNWFYPRVQREINAPTPRPAGRYARLSFTDYDAIPAFRFSDASVASRLRATLPIAAWLLALSALLAGLACLRLRRWPLDL